MAILESSMFFEKMQQAFCGSWEFWTEDGNKAPKKKNKNNTFQRETSYIKEEI